MAEAIPSQSSHQDLIREQFTKKAVLFSTSEAITNDEALTLLVQFSGAEKSDTVLDVGCGAGQVVCAFAQATLHATGIDLTPAMIEKAQALQAQKALANIEWKIGHVLPLPFKDGSFSIVTTRYTFHHFENPKAVMDEMVRVCAPGGKVVLADVFASPVAEKADAFNRMERLRDPSHVRAMPLAELGSLLTGLGLCDLKTAFYGLDFEVDKLLQGSFPKAGDEEKIRQVFLEEIQRDKMGIQARRQGSQILVTYPIVVLAGKKPFC